MNDATLSAHVRAQPVVALLLPPLVHVPEQRRAPLPVGLGQIPEVMTRAGHCRTEWHCNRFLGATLPKN